MNKQQIETEIRECEALVDTYEKQITEEVEKFDRFHQQHVARIAELRGSVNATKAIIEKLKPLTVRKRASATK